MKKFVKLFTTFLAVLMVVFLASCNSTKYTAQEMADAVSFDYEEKTVTFVIELPKTVERTFENSDKAQVEDIVWTSNDSRVTINNYFAEFTYDEAKKDEFATINATVNVGKESATNEFRFRIAKESNYEEFMGYKKDVEMAISGYVHYIGEFVPHKTSPDKKAGTASLILLDKTGTKFFYSHQTSMLPSVYQNLKVGQYVGITGKKDIYQGCHQVKGEVQKLPGADKLSTVAPVELTDANLAIENFVEDNSYAPATATLFVTNAPEDYKNQKRKAEVQALIKDSNGTTPVYLCNYDYLFNFDRDNPENNSQALKDVHAALMALQPGDTVNVQGYFATYKGTTAFYVNDAAKLEKVSSNPDYALAATEAERLAKVLDDAKTAVKGTYDLTPGADFTVEVTLSDATLTQFAYDATTHKFTITPDQTKVEVEVTVKVTKGEVSVSKVVSLTVQEIVMPEIIQTIVAANPNQPGADGKIKFYDLAYDGTNEAKVFGLDETVWTVTSTESYAGKRGISITDKNQMRFYGDRDGKFGAKLTLTSTNVEFQYVRLTMNNTSDFAKTFTINGEVVENVLKGTITIKLPSKVKELAIHNNATSGQVRIDKIELA